MIKDFPSKFRNDGRETLASSFMKFAVDLSNHSTCNRKKVGSVITDVRHERILCIGYNGNYCGGPNGCEHPESPGNCSCIHAENNCLIKSSESVRGAICYVTLSPCRMCAKLLINAGIGKIVYFEEYRDTSSLELLRSVGVEVEKF
jgi:dCMP deaminase